MSFIRIGNKNPDDRCKDTILSLKNREALIEVFVIIVIILLCFLVSLYWPWQEAKRSNTDFGLDYSPRRILSMLYPAIFYAGGYGMGTANMQVVPGLEEFVYGGALEFNCASIPKNTIVIPVTTPFESTHLYLLYGVGIFWRVFGVSIGTLHLFAACLCALCAGLLYALFRLGLGRFTSCFGAIVTCLSPLMMSSNLDLRDYAKAPFFLAVFLLLGYGITRTLSRRLFLLYSMIFGILLGIGVGVRTDLMICLPPAMVSLLFFIKIKGEKTFYIRIPGVILFCCFFGVTAKPILWGMSVDSGQQLTHHSYFMGLSSPYESTMGFGGASYVDFTFPDEATIAMVNTYARRLGNQESMVNTRSSEYLRSQGNLDAPPTVDPLLYYRGPMYGTMGRALMHEYINIFPADLVARAWCALYASLKAQSSVCTYGIQPDDPVFAGVKYLFLMEEKIAAHLGHYAIFYTVLALAGICARNLRTGVLLIILLAWFGGSTSLSFQYRHVFHLAFIPLFALLLLVRSILFNLFRLRHSEHRIRMVKSLSNPVNYAPPALRVFSVAILLSLMIAGPVFVLRYIQEKRVISFIEDIHAKSLSSVPVGTVIADGRLVVQPDRTALPGLKARPHGEAAWEYLAVTFTPGGKDIPISITYNDEDSDDLVIFGKGTENGETVTLYFPIYEIAVFPHPQMVEDTFKMLAGTEYLAEHEEEARQEKERILNYRRQMVGISLPQECSNTFKGFYRVEDTNGLKILPHIQVPEDKEHFRPYKKCSCEYNGLGIAPRS